MTDEQIISALDRVVQYHRGNGGEWIAEGEIAWHRHCMSNGQSWPDDEIVNPFRRTATGWERVMPPFRRGDHEDLMPTYTCRIAS